MNRAFLYRLIVIALFWSSPKFCQSQLVCDSTFFKEFTAGGNLEPYATKQLSNGEILVAGRFGASDGSPYQAMAAKFSVSGNLIWSFQTGGSADDRFTGIIELSDHSFLLSGVTASYGFPQGKILLVRVSSTGTILWSRQIGTVSTSTEQLKAILQYTDGDLLGTFTINDSTAFSDPVVFKMGLDGTVRWAKRLDHGGADCLTSLAFESSTIYAGGFYSSGAKKGVLTKFNSSNGSPLSSLNIYHPNPVYQQELCNLEIINNRMSYALRLRRDVQNVYMHNLLMIQSDTDGSNKTFERNIEFGEDTSFILFKRAPDNGFAFIRNIYSAEIIKLNMFSMIEWSRKQSVNSFNSQKNYDLDFTSSGGIVSAGYYRNFQNGNQHSLMLKKCNPMGNIGSCIIPGNTFFQDTVTVKQTPFNWNTIVPLVLDINQPVNLVTSPLLLQGVNHCDTTYCTDSTSLPPDCKKTLLTEYKANQSLILRDVVTTTDGGRIGVGTMFQNGWIVKFRNNGDVDWSKQMDVFYHEHDFTRIIRSSVNNVIAFANDYFTVDHGSGTAVRAVKMDNNGNVLLNKELFVDAEVEIADVTTAPDGGFVIIMNAHYGSGYLYTYVIRYNADMNIVWKKEIKHFALAPIYRSIFCNNNGVWFGHDSYDNYNLETIGLQKLDFATGNDVWHKRFLFANDAMRFNRIFVSNDTVFAFSYKITTVSGDAQISMLKLKDDGTLLQSSILQTDPLVMNFSYSYSDAIRPTITMTPQQDFVMSNQVRVNGSMALNVSRIRKDGSARWSRNYTGLTRHVPFNVHSQGTGTLIAGVVMRSAPYDYWNSDAFMLKTDSLGLIINGATGNCIVESRPLTPVNYAITETDPRIDSVVNIPVVMESVKPLLQLTKKTDATLFCYEQSACTPVFILQYGSGCNLTDTMTFYLGNNNCGVAAAWSYDTSHFTLVSMTADTLKLVPRQIGTSMVKAEVEDDCSLRIVSKEVSLLTPASQLNIGPDIQICPGSSSVVLHAGPGYNTYQWSDNSTDSLLTISSPGLYYVTVTDFCGGVVTDSIVVSLTGTDFVISGPLAKCNRDTVTLTATAGYLNYTWGPSSYINVNAGTAQVFPPATTQYYIQAEKFPGCIVRDTFVVIVNTSPPLQIGNDTTLCYDQSFQLNAPNGFVSYLWNTGSTTASITVNTPGTYSIRALFQNNCYSTDTIRINQFPFIRPDLGKDTSVCSNKALTLQPGNYSQYSWSNAAVSSSISVSAAGTYWVKVTDQNQCTGTDTIHILRVNSTPGNFLQDSVSICYGETVVLNPVGFYRNYNWSTGSTAGSLPVSLVGLYHLIVTDNNGCTGSDSTVVIQKVGCNNAIYFPSAFSPDNNGRNDIFKPVIYGQVRYISFSIYNRWGHQVFQTAVPGNGWDGRVNGLLQDPDIYVWVCRYQVLGYPEQLSKGTFMLIR